MEKLINLNALITETDERAKLIFHEGKLYITNKNFPVDFINYSYVFKTTITDRASIIKLDCDIIKIKIRDVGRSIKVKLDDKELLKNVLDICLTPLDELSYDLMYKWVELCYNKSDKFDIINAGDGVAFLSKQNEALCIKHSADTFRFLIKSSPKYIKKLEKLLYKEPSKESKKRNFYKEVKEAFGGESFKVGTLKVSINKMPYRDRPYIKCELENSKSSIDVCVVNENNIDTIKSLVNLRGTELHYTIIGLITHININITDAGDDEQEGYHIISINDTTKITIPKDADIMETLVEYGGVPVLSLRGCD